MAHPVRLRILSLLTGAALTAADVARELGLTHANASYHLRQLLAVGQIEVAGHERIRGGAAKRYRYDASRAVARRTEPPPDTAAAARQALYHALAAELTRRARDFRWAPEHQHFTDAELWVTPETWTAVRAMVDEASQLLHSAARPAHSPGTVRGSAAFVMFEMNP